MKIIGLSGRAAAGKDTVFEFIREWGEDQGQMKAENEIAVARDAFADRLKRSAAHAFGVFNDEIDFCDRLKQRESSVYVAMAEGSTIRVSGREFLQFYGTEAHRDVFGHDFWIEALFDFQDAPAAYASGRGQPDVLVITDCRFPNEAQAVRVRGGEVWEVRRPDHDGGDGIAHVSTSRLPSDLVDACICNDQGLDWLRVETRRMCQARL